MDSKGIQYLHSGQAYPFMLVMINLYCQLDWIERDLGLVKHISAVSVRGKTCPNVGSTIQEPGDPVE
jgi:hypothetical protein